MDYLDECVFSSHISSKFYKIFHRIPRDLIDRALRDEGKTVEQVIVRCAEIQGTELSERAYYREIGNISRIRPREGQRQRGGISASS